MRKLVFRCCLTRQTAIDDGECPLCFQSGSNHNYAREYDPDAKAATNAQQIIS